MEDGSLCLQKFPNGVLGNILPEAGRSPANQKNGL
jgi:hypothetical protein